MGLGKFLRKVVDLVVKARDLDPRFPPLIFCPICHGRTVWLTASERWACLGPIRHEFTEYDPAFANIPLPRLPGDEGFNHGEI